MASDFVCDLGVLAAASALKSLRQNQFLSPVTFFFSSFQPPLSMPDICPICTKTCRSNQKQIECSSCNCWIHHGNRLNCSGLTDTEFSLHSNDDNKFFECDNCIAGDTIKTFPHLPQFDLPTVDSTDQVNIFSSAKNNHKEFISKCSSI